MPARSVATVAREAGGGGVPTRDFSAGHALFPEWTVSGRRRAVELAPPPPSSSPLASGFCFFFHRKRRLTGKKGSERASFARSNCQAGVCDQIKQKGILVLIKKN